MPAGGLRFDRDVPAGGYLWWYLDALSEDGQHGVTLIAFVGSVFSPYYAWARRRGDADPLNHCALNVALYGPRAGRWSMTERAAAALTREQSAWSLGNSALHWSGDALHITVDEVCAPIPFRLRGTIRLTPSALTDASYALDANGLHRWTPFAPCSHLELRFSDPALQWSGMGYFDSNFGEEPVESAFRDWTWSRAARNGSTVVLYDTAPRRSAARSLALQFSRDGRVEDLEPPPLVDLPATRWRVSRRTRAEAGFESKVVKTFEDAPFYSRSLLDTRLLGEAVPAIHESLDLDRFRSRWVQCLLPFRMPRRFF